MKPTNPQPAKGKMPKARRLTCKSCFGSGRIEDENDAPGTRRCDDCVGRGYYYAKKRTPGTLKQSRALAKFKNLGEEKMIEELCAAYDAVSPSVCPACPAGLRAALQRIGLIGGGSSK